MGGILREIAIWAAEVRVFIYDILGLCRSARPILMTGVGEV